MASVTLGGDAASGLTEAQVVAGTKTIILDLTGDTWVADAVGTASYGTGNVVTGTGTSINAQLTGVSSGSLIVAWVKWESDTTTITSIGDGTSTLSLGTLKRYGGSQSGQFAYLLSSVATGSVTYTTTMSASVSHKLLLMEFKKTGGSFAYESHNEGSGYSTSLNSGNITTGATSAVVVGGYAEIGTETFSAQQINGVSATLPSEPNTGYPKVWYRLNVGAFTNGAATATLGASADWVCNVVSFTLA